MFFVNSWSTLVNLFPHVPPCSPNFQALGFISGTATYLLSRDKRHFIESGGTWGNIVENKGSGWGNKGRSTTSQWWAGTLARLMEIAEVRLFETTVGEQIQIVQFCTISRLSKPASAQSRRWSGSIIRQCNLTWVVEIRHPPGKHPMKPRLPIRQVAEIRHLQTAV